MEFDDNLDRTEKTDEERSYSPEPRVEKRGDLGFKRMMNGTDHIDWREKDGAVAAIKGAEVTLSGKTTGVRFAIRTKQNNGALKESERADSKINKLNEDGFLLIRHEGRTIMVVFDGVGQESGLKGTEMAAVAFYEAIKEGATLKEALEKANAALYAYSKQNPTRGMAATVIVAAEIEGDEGEMVWAGDAEGQLLDENSEPVDQTVPHNRAALGFQKGLTREDYWKDRKGRGPVYSALGILAHPEIGEMKRTKLKPGWRFVLRSDGSSDNSSGHETAKLVKGRRDAAEALNALFAHQMKVAGQDSIQIEDVEENGTPFTISLKPKGDNVTMGVLDYLGEEPLEVPQTLIPQGLRNWLQGFGDRARKIIESTWFGENGQA